MILGGYIVMEISVLYCFGINKNINNNITIVIKKNKIGNGNVECLFINRII